MLRMVGVSVEESVETVPNRCSQNCVRVSVCICGCVCGSFRAELWGFCHFFSPLSMVIFLHPGHLEQRLV